MYLYTPVCATTSRVAAQVFAISHPFCQYLSSLVLSSQVTGRSLLTLEATS